ncbi:MAG TPA: 6-phosphogluconolactonase [Rubrivivax sp.]|nr:6-phosphogluconolactonase [Rubrivivax sp.]
MQVEILADDAAVARHAAAFIAAQARAAVQARGQFTLAVSGGRTPWAMLRALAGEDLPWAQVQLFQVDERIAPAGDPARNLTHIQASLLDHAPLPAANVHAMPVESRAADLQAAAQDYARTLQRVAGMPAVLDLVHLGLGTDGHTASLVPGDAALQVLDADVALTAPYMGHRRMTLAYPGLNRARCVLWLATGAEKREMAARLRAGDPGIPAGRVQSGHAWLLGDVAALG